MRADMKIAVAGATGRVGRHLVDVLEAGGHEVVPMSRATGVDLTTGEGLDGALAGVERVVDVATGPESEYQAATDFFTAASRNLQEAGRRAGVQRMVVVSIIGADKFTGGYIAGKVVHEQAMLSGPIPVRILRAAQFHEFVEQMVDWGRQGDMSYVPKMRTQLVAARTVAEGLAELVIGGEAEGPILELAGPREERLVEMARLLFTRQGDSLRIEEGDIPGDPDSHLWAEGALLPGPDAKLAGPTFAEWLESAPEA